jgi:hypothetical protein
VLVTCGRQHLAGVRFQVSNPMAQGRGGILLNAWDISALNGKRADGPNGAAGKMDAP